MQGVKDEVGLCVQTQFAHHVGTVDLNSAGTNIQSAGNFGIGVSQFGYRYSLDFLPLLLLLLIPVFNRGIPRFAQLLIMIGIIFNSLYMLSIWNSYPVFKFFGLL